MVPDIFVQTKIKTLTPLTLTLDLRVDGILLTNLSQV